MNAVDNARASYYLAKGGMEGSWKALPRDVILVNWNANRPDQSVRFFAERGFRQIISLPMGGSEERLQRMVQIARSHPGILGYQYTSWARDYSHIPLFDRLTADRGAP